MFLNSAKELIFIIISITVLAESLSSYCNCTGTQRVINIFPTHQGNHCSCCVAGFNEILKKNSTAVKMVFQSSSSIKVCIL